METKFYPQREMIFTKHPTFDNVKAAMFITSKEADIACVCLVEIAPGSETPIHTHEERCRENMAHATPEPSPCGFLCITARRWCKGKIRPGLASSFFDKISGTQIKNFLPWELDS
jgi:hypothetical protein